MNRIFGILAGVGVGLGLMYLLDPDRGARRRALIRDKAVGMKNDLTQLAEAKATDMTNKAKGLLHEAKSAFSDLETKGVGSESRPA